MSERQWPSYLNLVVGVWLIVSPWALGYASLPSALWNTLLVGVLVALLAGYRLVRGWALWAAWAEVALGVWLWIAPMALGYSNASLPGAGPASANGYVFGTLVAVFALWGLVELRTPGTEGLRATFSAAEPTEQERRKR